MRQECIQAVNLALGRSATAGETRDIENRIRLSMRKLAGSDPVGWRQLSAPEQLQRAAVDAAQSISHEAAVKRLRTAQAILAHDRMRNYIDAQVASGYDKNGIEALERMLASKADGKNNVISVESSRRGIEANASRLMSKSWNVAGGKFLHLLRDKLSEATLVRALHGDKTTPKAFQDAAADFHDAAESLRQRFNAAGGDIGRLDNWGMPHSWSDARVIKAGRQTWTDFMLPLMDRSRYAHEDGRPYTDAEMRGLLDEAWTSVATGGANKVMGAERAPSGGIKANRNRAERQIHLKDADAYMAAMGKFSERGVMDAMMGHISRLSRDIALVEQFGPNADRQFAYFLDQETAKAKIDNPGRKGVADKQAKFAERLYNFQAGNGAPPPESWHGKALQVWRDLNVLKLGSTLISSIADYGTMHLTAHVNGIPSYKMFLNELRALNPADKSERAIAESAGLMVREYSQQLARYGGDIGSHGWSQKLSNTFLKVTLLPYATEARRRAFSYGMMDQVGKAVRDFDTLDKLNDADQRFLKRSGITQDDWDVMRLAQADDWGGNHTMLTPDSIYRIPDADVAKVTNEDPRIAKDRAASNLMGFVIGEQDRAVIEPGVRTRVRLGADKPADGIAGFISKSFALFKSFSFELTEQHLNRALHAFETKKGSAAYLAALIASTTILGAVANGIKDIVSGRDPRTLNLSSKDGWKNWVASLTTGGGLGLYGDFLVNTYGSHGSTLAEQVAGPLVADASTLLNVGQQAVASTTDPNADLMKQIRPTGPSTVNALKAYVPGASLWYTKAAMDHLIFNQLSDQLSPGYLNRMKAKARQQKRTNWWEPDQGTPSRAPDLSSSAR